MSNYQAPSPFPPPYPGPPYPGSANPYARSPYAHWLKRVGATLLDSVVPLAGLVPVLIGLPIMHSAMESHTEPDDTTTTQIANHTVFGVGLAMIIIGYLLTLVIGIWNQVYRQGKTGQSLGKKVLGITTVKEHTRQPLGFWVSLWRQVLHIADSLLCYIGYLWPLWDAKRQTFSDKIVGAVVLDAPPEQVIPRQPVPWAPYPN